MLKKIILLSVVLKCLQLLFILSNIGIAHAQDNFFISSEMQIGKIKNLIDKADPGIYVTVGAERAFRGASMFTGVEHLIILDISPEIIRYNMINIELLKAPNKEKYKHLRWYAEFDEWQQISQALTNDDFTWWNNKIRNIQGYTLPEELNKYGKSLYAEKYLIFRSKLLFFYPELANKFNQLEINFLRDVSWSDVKDKKINFSQEDFSWFETERSDPKSCINTFILNKEQALDLGRIIDYKSGNYLFDDKLYARLHKLVSDNTVTVMQIDLTSLADLKVAHQAIEKINLPIAVLDLDNLYNSHYLGEERFRTALFSLLKYGNSASVLILMHNYAEYSCAQFSIYVGFTFEHVKNWQDKAFIEKLMFSSAMETYPLLDGRLYQSQDLLPNLD